jgi:prepilin-type N-terminal cleavage/methylation domain-containing protein
MSMKLQTGYTLLELVVTVAITAILAGIALPVYKDYQVRAELSEVMVIYDSIVIKAGIIAAESGRSLCNWPMQNSSQTQDIEINSIRQIVDDSLKTLDPKYWSVSTSGLNLDKKNSSAAMTVLYSGIGRDGVHRAELLAETFQGIGRFEKWHLQKASFAAFSVLLDHCASTGPSTVISAVTSLPSHSTQPQIKSPVTPNTNVAPPVATPTTSAPQSTAPTLIPTPIQIPTQTAIVAGIAGSTSSIPPTVTQHPATHPSLLNYQQQTQQCRANCRVIYPHGNSRAYRNCLASC